MYDERHEHRAAGLLSGIVGRATGYRHTGHAPGVHVGLPSLSITLVIPLESRLTVSERSEAGSGTDFTTVVAGLHSRPAYIHHDGTQYGMQLALAPTAVRQVFGCPAADLAGGSYDLADVLGPSSASLSDRLHEPGSWEERFAVLEAALVDLLTEQSAPAPEVSEAWRLVGRPGRALQVREIADRIGWSTRHLQQRFRAEFGVTPKEALRIRRFERSADLFRGAQRRLADVAAICGYADQAHLNREWRALAGAPPTRWQAQDDLAFVQDEPVGATAGSTP